MVLDVYMKEWVLENNYKWDILDLIHNGDRVLPDKSIGFLEIEKF